MKKKTEVDAKESTAMQPANPSSDAKMIPSFVEAEKMFERLAEITKETAQRAFEFFRDRGGELGKELDDWFKAENEILRPVPVEVTESDDNIFVNAAVAGFKPEEIEVSVKGNVLIISGSTETNDKKTDTNTIVREWSSNRFYRQLTLPSEVMEDKVHATLSSGMLTLTLPKTIARDAIKVAVASA